MLTKLATYLSTRHGHQNELGDSADTALSPVKQVVELEEKFPVCTEQLKEGSYSNRGVLSNRQTPFVIFRKKKESKSGR